MSVRAAAASSRPRLVPAHSLSWWDSPTHGGHHRTTLTYSDRDGDYGDSSEKFKNTERL